MFDAIEGLNRDTIARNNGAETDTSAMNHFCRLIFESKNGMDSPSYRNRLEWITTYEGLNPNLRKEVEEKIKELDSKKGKDYQEGVRVK